MSEIDYRLDLKPPTLRDKIDLNIQTRKELKMPNLVQLASCSWPSNFMKSR